MAQPVVYRAPKFAPPIQQSSEMFAEQYEAIPAPLGDLDANWPPFGFATVTASEDSDMSSAVPLISRRPQGANLEWVCGDTFTEPFFFTEVAWTDTDPNPIQTIESADLTSNVATLYTQEDHKFVVGAPIVVTDVGAPFDGEFTITAIDNQTVSYAVTNADIPLGSVSGNAEMSGLPTWEEAQWASQIRNPYLMSTYASDYWVPANGVQWTWWKSNSMVGFFYCYSEMAYIAPDPDLPDEKVWATKVTIDLTEDISRKIRPGSWYRWDLAVKLVDTGAVKRQLRGKVNILTAWTI